MVRRRPATSDAVQILYRFGEPDIDILREKDGKIRVKDVEVFKPQTGEGISDSAEGSVKFSSRAGIVHFELNAIGLRSYLHVSYFWDSVWAKGVRQHGDHGSLGNKFT